MDITNILEQISRTLNEVQILAKQNQTQNLPPRVSVDLALTKTMQLYDSLLCLQKTLSADIEILESKSDAIVSEQTPLVEPVYIPEIIEQAKEPEIVEQIAEPETVLQDELDVSKVELEEQPQQKKHVIPSNSDVDVSQKIGKKPISNIAAAIGINERFQFIKELFQNNVELYTGAIQELNELTSFELAYTLLQKKYNLDFDNELVQRFLSIVERRYL
ncbi:MAG: hypothetical protein M0R02_05540 [Bacteroidales bacterium]|nr:hypothetical protein [Bacteroidales bacterium]NLK81978.1 hypothetical protein [Bacteroidales bacterium]HPY82210.1 hypothetical protein [Bacteroidales bacterium]